ncbi:MAG: DivIVA domain-containing protein [Acidimicrobiales bacterium]
MDVTPQLLHDVEFREAKRGGYNTQDVDDFLERLAVGLERQDASVRDARQRIEAAEARAAEAERRAVQAEQRASDTSDSDETLKRTLVLAQRTADAAIREAEEQASKTLSSAQDQAARLLADAQETSARARAEAEDDARRAQQDARDLVQAEMRELEAARDQLHDDVDVLERHLEEQRDRLRHSVRELQMLLDDPAALRQIEVPVVSDVRAPEPEAPRMPLVAADDADLDDDMWGAADDRFQPAPPPSPAYADVVADRGDGPPTEAVDVLAERDADDDAYLTELRKAMTDDTPLGPREEDDDALFDGGADTGRSRFGRRR